jgi:hypothetical protein
MDNFEKGMAFAKAMVESGFLPEAIRTPAQAFAIIVYGKEIDIPEMTALQHVNVIKGKPTLSAQIIRAIILKRCQGAKISYITKSDDREKCVLKAERPGQESREYSFSMAEAMKIKTHYDYKEKKQKYLVDKDSWKNYPSDMLLARATTKMARGYFPDIIGWASYTPEEIETVPVPEKQLPILYKKKDEEPDVITVDTDFKAAVPTEQVEVTMQRKGPDLIVMDDVTEQVQQVTEQVPPPEPEYIGEEKTLDRSPEPVSTPPPVKNNDKVQDLANKIKGSTVTTEKVTEVEKLREEMIEVFGDDPRTLSGELKTLSTFTGSDGKVRYKTRFDWLSEPHAAACRAKLKVVSFSSEMETAGIPKEQQDEIVGFIAQELKYDDINGLNDIRSLKQLFPIRDQFRKAQNEKKK